MKELEIIMNNQRKVLQKIFKDNLKTIYVDCNSLNFNKQYDKSLFVTSKIINTYVWEYYDANNNVTTRIRTYHFDNSNINHQKHFFDTLLNYFFLINIKLNNEHIDSLLNVFYVSDSTLIKLDNMKLLNDNIEYIKSIK